MTKLIPIQTYKLGTVPLSTHKINLVNTSMNPIDVLTNTSKVSMINKNPSVKPIKNIKNIKLNPNNLDISISEVESGGDYSAVNKHSGAMGKYQFQEEHLPLIKEVTGISSKEEFLNNPEKQEEFFNYWKDNVLIPETQRVRELGLGKDLNDEELASLLHFQGLPNTLKYLKGEKDMNKRYGHNISVNEYLNKTKNQTGGNLDNEDLTSKLLNFYKRENPELNDKDILIDLYYKSQSNQLKSGGNINEVVPIKMSSNSTAINVPINSSLYKDLYPNLYSYDKSQDIYSAAELPEVEIRAKRLPKGTYENHFNKVHKLIKQYEFNDDKAKEHADAIVTTGINKKIDPMFIAAMAQKESNFGANLTTPYNPLNYGNTDDGRTKSFPDYQTAYNTFGEYAIRNGLIKPGETTNDILKRGLKTQLGVYSTNPNYVKDIKKIYNSNMEKVKQPELPKIYLKK